MSKDTSLRPFPPKKFFAQSDFPRFAKGGASSFGIKGPVAQKRLADYEALAANSRKVQKPKVPQYCNWLFSCS